MKEKNFLISTNSEGKLLGKTQALYQNRWFGMVVTDGATRGLSEVVQGFNAVPSDARQRAQNYAMTALAPREALG